MEKYEDREINLEQLVARVESCDLEEVEAVIDALQRRYRRLFPEWEVVFEAYPVREPENNWNPQITLVNRET